MKSTRHLALRRETLTELTDAELTLAGGAAPTLYAGCSYDDVTELAADALRKVTLHPHCSWSCI